MGVTMRRMDSMARAGVFFFMKKRSSGATLAAIAINSLPITPKLDDMSPESSQARSARALWDFPIATFWRRGFANESSFRETVNGMNFPN